jgi:GGDEF domain-containing protein
MTAVPDPEPAPDGDDGPEPAISWPPEAERRAPSGDRPTGSSSPDPLWMGALHDELVRAQRTGSPLSLLLVELEDADRVLAADGEHEAAATFGRFARAVRGVARRQDILACESDARAWVIARDTARAGARALGERIVGAVRESHHWRGAPLTVSLGVAVFGEDGRDGDELIQAAEEAMFVAAASGSEIGDGVGESPGGPGTEFVS